MAAPALSQVLAMDAALKKVYENAITEFMDTITPEMSIYEVREVAVAIAAKYQMLGSRLGALWYDVCAELAGLRLDPAELIDIDLEAIERKLSSADTEQEITNTISEIIKEAMRQTGEAALWRDHRRGLKKGKWCRVPTGDTTCAWCLMLASNGAWYLSEETALGGTPDVIEEIPINGKMQKTARFTPSDELRDEASHYHANCDCIAVYYADAEDIAGYDALFDYKAMYYAADEARINGDYSEEMAARLLAAKAKHERDFLEKKTDRPWTKYNATMMLMREMFGLK